MNLEKVISISGKPGLFALKVQTRTAYLAESLLDGKKVSVNLRSNVSVLSEISIYTMAAEKPLTEVMRNIAIKENEGPSISHKEENAVLIAYFKEILPEYDDERVYPSDIKKIINWYNLLQSKGLISKDIPTEIETNSTVPKVEEQSINDKVEDSLIEENTKE